MMCKKPINSVESSSLLFVLFFCYESFVTGNKTLIKAWIDVQISGNKNILKITL